MAVTTIKVEMSLRDRLNEIARRDGVSVSRAIEGMVAARERSERFHRLRDVMAMMTDTERREYLDEVAEWDSASLDDRDVHHADANA